jgi:lipid-A-disaccharide synthase-like uncharacterized protein
MPPPEHFPFINGKFLGIDWTVWEVVGWTGNLVFFSRFIVQWFATEKRKQVVVPALFWWLSIIGSLLLLGYALFYKHSPVFIFAYAFSWIPYARNLVIHHRHENAQRPCAECGLLSPPAAAFCSRCGASLVKAQPAPPPSPDFAGTAAPALTSSESKLKPPSR